MRAFGVSFEFLAKLTHVDAQVFCMIGIGGSPNVSQDALMCEHASMIGGEIRQQLVFGAGEGIE